MKQRLSAGALALQLSWKPVLLVFLAVTGIQLCAFGKNIDEYASFAERMGETFEFPGKIGFVALLIVLILVGVEFRGAKFSYTLRRLGVPERELTLLWAAVFSGWFLLYWIVQLGLILGCFVWFARGQELEPTALFMASYLDDYFHVLLPMGERFGYLRNVLVCIALGSNAAFSSHQIRHKASAWAPGVLVTACGILLNGELGAYPADIIVMIVIVFQVLICWGTLGKGEPE